MMCIIMLFYAFTFKLLIQQGNAIYKTACPYIYHVMTYVRDMLLRK